MKFTPGKRAWLHFALGFFCGLALMFSLSTFEEPEPEPEWDDERFGIAAVMEKPERPLQYPVNVRKVIDGNTVDLTFNLGPVRNGQIGFGIEIKRLLKAGFETLKPGYKPPSLEWPPDTIITLKARCKLYGVHAPDATEELEKLLGEGLNMTARMERDSSKSGYPRVTLFNSDGENVNKQMLDGGYGVAAPDENENEPEAESP